MTDELQEKLTKLNSHLSCELITKDETKAELNGNFLELQQQEAGDVIIKYADEPVLIMSKVEGIPSIELKVTYVDKFNSKMFANLIELCGSYLPDNEEEK